MSSVVPRAHRQREGETERETMGASESTSSSSSPSSSSSSSGRSLEYAPTWALATVATAFIVISFVVERLLHFLGSVSMGY